jgi:hypothetical protein
MWPRRRISILAGATGRDVEDQASCDCTFAKCGSAGADVRRSSGYGSFVAGTSAACCVRALELERIPPFKEP